MSVRGGIRRGRIALRGRWIVQLRIDAYGRVDLMCIDFRHLVFLAIGFPEYFFDSIIGWNLSAIGCHSIVAGITAIRSSLLISTHSSYRHDIIEAFIGKGGRVKSVWTHSPCWHDTYITLIPSCSNKHYPARREALHCIMETQTYQVKIKIS